MLHLFSIISTDNKSSLSRTTLDMYCFKHAAFFMYLHVFTGNKYVYFYLIVANEVGVRSPFPHFSKAVFNYTIKIIMSEEWFCDTVDTISDFNISKYMISQSKFMPKIGLFSTYSL